MKPLGYLILVILFLSLTKAQTSNQYQQSFDEDVLGWSHTAWNANLYAENSLMYFQTNEPEDFAFLFPPIPATKNDFSLKIFGGGINNPFISGIIGRAGFKSFIGFYITSGLIFVVFTNDIMDYTNPSMTLLHGQPYQEISNLELNVYKTGNDLNILAYLNDGLIYSGQIADAEDDILYGQIVLGASANSGEHISFALDEIQINYNAINETPGYFVDEFAYDYSPWFRFGDLENAAQSISIGGGYLNFIYNQPVETELIVSAPVGATRNFAMEVEANGFLSNGTIGIGRFVDYHTYTSLWIEEGNLYLGYLDGQIIDDPYVVNQISVGGMNIQKIKFSVTGTPPILELSGWINDNLILTGNINDASPKLGYGHLSLSVEKSNIYNFLVDRIVITYDDYLTTLVEDNPFLKKEFTLWQNYPNPFNPTTIIKFTIPNVGDENIRSQQTKLIVYDILGHKVQTLLNEIKAPGMYEVEFNANNLASGVYFYQLRSGNYISNKKMMLIR